MTNHKKAISLPHAPPIGTYSTAVQAGELTFLSGQIPLDPQTQTVPEDISAQIHLAFHNLRLVCEASGGSLDKMLKLTIYLTDLQHFALLNQIMAEYFSEPYPARAVIGVSQLPRGVAVEIEGVMHHS